MKSEIRTGLAFCHDLLMACIAYLFTLYLRIGDRLWQAPQPALMDGLIVYLAIAALVFAGFGLYRGLWRYASIRDVVQLFKACTLHLILFLLVRELTPFLHEVPRSMAIASWFVLLTLLGAGRLAYRLLREAKMLTLLNLHPQDRVPVLLVGAGNEADIFIRSLAMDSNSAYRVVGIIDDKDSRHGRSLNGVAVLGGLADLSTVCMQLFNTTDQPQKLILTAPPHRFGLEATRKLLAQATELGLALASLPALTEFQTPNTSRAISTKPIALEDLLGRPQIALSVAPLVQLFQNRRVLVTGAGGSIGAEIVKQLAALGPQQIILLELSEYNLYRISQSLQQDYPHIKTQAILADVRNEVRMAHIFAEHQPELVLHAAALKHVPIAEQNPHEAVSINVLGTRIIADAAIKAGCIAMVLISTDKAVNPSNIMGASKRLAESYCQSCDAESPSTRLLTVRFGNVLGASGSVVPLFQQQIAEGGPVTVTHPDMTRYFMSLAEAVTLVLQTTAHALAKPNQRGRVYVLDMGEPIKITDLAQQMIRLAGLRPQEDIPIIFTGLRPGEKLHEELFNQNEVLEASGVRGVLLARAQPIDAAQLQTLMDEAIKAAQSWQSDATLRQSLKNAVPEFAP